VLGTSQLWAGLRIGAALVGLSGVVTGLIVNVDRASREGWDLSSVLANYFSLFTILSTLLSVIALTAAAVWSLRTPGTSREPFGIALGLAVVIGPILLLGVVYNLLLRSPASGVALTDPPGIAFLDSWSVETLHVLLPIYLICDVLLAPRRRGLPWWCAAVVVAYPIAWVTYTMLRGLSAANPAGSAAGWYPYPFLDPRGSGGYPSALTYIAVMTVGLLLIGVVIIAIGRRRARRDAQPRH
jgi:hypothetical protein